MRTKVCHLIAVQFAVQIAVLIAVQIVCWQGAARAQQQPYARDNRFAFNLSFGFGSASLSSFHGLVDDVLGAVKNQSGVTIDEAPKSGLQINAELAFRYYFPYHVLAQVGYATLYNKASTSFGSGIFKGSIYNDNLVMETPILVGGYYTFIDRLYVLGAVGPSVFFFPRSWWDAEPNGAILDFKADPGVGFHALAGADFLVAEHLAVGLEIRYRYLKTGELKELDHGVTVTSVMLGLGGNETYDMDWSGVSLAVVLRFYAT